MYICGDDAIPELIFEIRETKAMWYLLAALPLRHLNGLDTAFGCAKTKRPSKCSAVIDLRA
jgi:hypothetical protein